MKRGWTGYDQERNHFIYLRVKDMTEEEYAEFIHCRQIRILSKGIKTILDWLQIRREGTELRERKIIEMFGYIVRIVL